MPQDGIDVSQIEVATLTGRPFPGTCPFRIAIAEQAHQAVWQHARETLLDGDQIKEVGGILVGNVFKDGEGPFLEIKAAIAAEHTRNEGTEVAFTPETWEQINRTKDKLYPKDKIVGWYHTHPRFGIFLSERDKFVQQHSFPQPWATAFVVDPVQNVEGFFFWSEGEPREAPEYWIGQERRERSILQDGPSTPHERTNGEAESRSVILRTVLPLAAILGLVALLLVGGVAYMREAEHTELELFAMRALESQKAELERTLQTLLLLRKDVEHVDKQAEVADAEVQRKMQELENGLHNIGAIATLLRLKVDEIRKALPKESLIQLSPAKGKQSP